MSCLDVDDSALARATLDDMLRRQARRQPDKVAVVAYSPGAGRVEMSYRELHATAAGVGEHLIGLGVARGEVVATLLPTSVPLVVAYCAALGIGAPFTAINPALTDEELAHHLRHAAPRALVLADEDRTRVTALLDEPTTTDRTNPPVLISPAELAAVPPATGSVPVRPVGESDIAAIVYTSGTESTPKGVMVSHRNFLIGTTPAWVYTNYLVASDVFLLLAPGYTMAGLGTVTNVLSVGASAVLAPAAQPDTALAAIAAERVTVTSQTPTFYRRLAEAPGLDGADLSSLRQLHVYGGSIPAAAVERFGQLAPGAEWATYWGQSELSQLGCVGYFRQVADIPSGNLRWIGRPMPHVEVRVVDEDGNDTTTGEMLCRSPAVMLGYYRDPQRTAECLRDGWLRTGDVVTVDEHGNLFFADRRKEIVKTGGMNVSASEVETVIARHPGVAAVAVLGVPDEEWSELVTAVVVIRPGHQVDAADIRRFCRERLTGYKVPKRVEFIDELPYDTQGKLRKRELRAWIEATG